MNKFEPHVKMVDGEYGPKILFSCEDINIEKNIDINGITYFDEMLHDGLEDLYDKWSEKYPNETSQNKKDVIEKSIKKMITKFGVI